MTTLVLSVLLLGFCPSKHDAFHGALEREFGREYSVILVAAKRNKISERDYENLAILFAIRKAENGRHGKEFGVISNPRAIGREDEPWTTTLDRQAGWAAATIVNNRVRWRNAGEQGEYLVFLANRYAPIGADNDPTGLNRNWYRNTKHWRDRFLSALD